MLFIVIPALIPPSRVGKVSVYVADKTNQIKELIEQNDVSIFAPTRIYSVSMMACII